jgi:hypothetical protein
MRPSVSISPNPDHGDLDEDELTAFPLHGNSLLRNSNGQLVEKKNKARKRIGPPRPFISPAAQLSSTASPPILIESSEEEEPATELPTRKRKRSSLPTEPFASSRDAQYEELLGGVGHSQLWEHSTSSTTLGLSDLHNSQNRGSRVKRKPAPPPVVQTESMTSSSSEVDNDDCESTYDSDFTPPDHEVIIPHPDIPSALTPYHPRGAIPWMKVPETRWRDIADVRRSPEDSYLYKRSKKLKVDLSRVSRPY